jgi:hypothetical protein
MRWQSRQIDRRLCRWLPCRAHRLPKMVIGDQRYRSQIKVRQCAYLYPFLVCWMMAHFDFQYQFAMVVLCCIWLYMSK